MFKKLFDSPPGDHQNFHVYQIVCGILLINSKFKNDIHS
jgi:hypothetical protein